jgi:hypothetical protein
MQEVDEIKSLSMTKCEYETDEDPMLLPLQKFHMISHVWNFTCET